MCQPAAHCAAMENKHIIVAIDGQAGVGKGTLAKRLATHFGFKYLDTGTLYRAVTLRVLESDGDTTDANTCIAAAKDGFDFDFKHLEGLEFASFLGARNIEDLIRTREVSQKVPDISNCQGVRDALFDFQVQFARDWKAKTGVILDGRDIGTRICPDAELKFFLDAAPEVRAQRRLQELRTRGLDVEFEAILADVKARDARDANNTKPASDAIMIDTSTMNANAVFDLACKRIKETLST